MNKIEARNEAIARAQHILANPDKFCILDSETTGWGNNEIMSISITDPSGALLLDKFCVPLTNVEPEALDTHHITPQVLTEKKAKTWVEVSPLVAAAVKGRTVLIYNRSYDVGAINSTDQLHSQSTNIGTSECVMRMYQSFLKKGSWPALVGGDHTSLGDCRAVARVLAIIAAGKPEQLPVIESEGELVAIQKQIDKLSWQRRQLGEREDLLKAQAMAYLSAKGLTSISLSSGKKLEVVTSIKGISPMLALEDMPQSLVKTAIDTKAVKAAITENAVFGEDNDPIDALVSYERSSYLKITKSKKAK